MKQEHQELLNKLVIENRFPVSVTNTSDKEQEMINDMMSTNTKKQLNIAMKKAIQLRDKTT